MIVDIKFMFFLQALMHGLVILFVTLRDKHMEKTFMAEKNLRMDIIKNMARRIDYLSSELEKLKR